MVNPIDWFRFHWNKGVLVSIQKERNSLSTRESQAIGKMKKILDKYKGKKVKP